MGQQTSESWTKWQKVDLKKKIEKRKRGFFCGLFFKKFVKKTNYYKFLFIYKNNIKFS